MKRSFLSTVVLALWVAVRSGETWTGTVPASLVALLASPRLARAQSPLDQAARLPI